MSSGRPERRPKYPLGHGLPDEATRELGSTRAAELSRLLRSRSMRPGSEKIQLDAEAIRGNKRDEIEKHQAHQRALRKAESAQRAAEAIRLRHQSTGRVVIGCAAVSDYWEEIVDGSPDLYYIGPSAELYEARMHTFHEDTEAGILAPLDD